VSVQITSPAVVTNLQSTRLSQHDPTLRTPDLRRKQLATLRSFSPCALPSPRQEPSVSLWSSSGLRTLSELYKRTVRDLFCFARLTWPRGPAPKPSTVSCFTVRSTASRYASLDQPATYLSTILWLTPLARQSTVREEPTLLDRTTRSNRVSE